MAVKDGSSVVECAFLYEHELNMAKKHGTSWYRSKELRGGHPFTSYMLNKKWTLNEEFNNHMLRFQQVRKLIYFNKLHFYIPGWIGGQGSSFQSESSRF